MQKCISASAENAPIVPNKRVNYAFGMVLGVRDFVQEQAHFEWKSRLANRLPHGYGTLCGLDVVREDILENGTLTDVEIKIAPGYAISPKGNWLWLEDELCARLAAWVEKNKAARPAPDTAGPDTGRNHVYVRLCYVECPVDAVPIAANPCASAEDNTAAARILETVAADFSWTRPAQDEVTGTAAFAATLATETDLAQIHADLIEWATDERPALSANGCVPPDDAEDCLLLARITFTFDTTTDKADLTTVALHEEERSVLADTRLLQEWLAALQTTAMMAGDAAGGDLSGTYPDPFVETSHGKLLVKHDDPAGGDLTGTYPNPIIANNAVTTDKIANGAVTTVKLADGAITNIKVTDVDWSKITNAPTSLPAGGPAGGDLTGTYPNPTIAPDVVTNGKLASDAASLAKVSGGAMAAASGNIGIGTNAPGAQLDVAGSVFLTGFRLSTAPTAGFVLTSDAAGGGTWQPPPTATVDTDTIVNIVLGNLSRIPVVELASIRAITEQNERDTFFLWFHLTVDGANHLEIVRPEDNSRPIAVLAETDDGGSSPPFLVARNTPSAATSERNVWTLSLRTALVRERPLLRFVFLLNRIMVRDTTGVISPDPFPLRELIARNLVRWNGYDGGNTVTVYFDRRSMPTNGLG